MARIRLELLQAWVSALPASKSKTLGLLKHRNRFWYSKWRRRG